VNLPPAVAAETDGIVLTVRLTPRGGRDAVDGIETDAAGRAMLKCRVAAPPEDGAANSALIALLAKRLDTARSALTLESGLTRRVKRIRIAGDAATLAARVARLLEER